ncbi:hypothetical protein [Xanthomonas theicola]|uniref:hypothetical protein n=1 Tax=Xanthomonas theicola TaxID=56464 RepID=UPI000FF8B4CA|nr:hypothetical protein [Xanthomonas theicola]QNH25600.1 hypothetical protein G4Q83_13760 [Xanthomonas theicola]
MPVVNLLNAVSSSPAATNDASAFASHSTLPIIGVGGSSKTFAMQNGLPARIGFYGHDLAYSKHKPRVRRDDSAAIPYGTYSENVCLKTADRLEEANPRVNVFPYPPDSKRIVDEYKRVVNSPDCRLVLTTTTSMPPLFKPWGG